MSHTLSLEWAAIWKIFVVSILLGAGLPAVFALGVRSLAYGQGGDAETHAAGTAAAAGHPIGRAVAALCFAVVIAAVALGITFIVASGFGKELNFDHIYPVIQDK
jgi:hypothetical protein